MVYCLEYSFLEEKNAFKIARFHTPFRSFSAVILLLYYQDLLFFIPYFIGAFRHRSRILKSAHTISAVWIGGINKPYLTTHLTANLII